MAFLFRLFVCIALCGISLYAYVNKHNALTMVRMRVPIAAKELALVEEENVRLQFAIEKFENPLHLMELARKPEFAHLKHPYVQDILSVDMKNDTE